MADEQKASTSQAVSWPPAVVFYPPPHGLRGSRLRALLAVARSPGWDVPVRESSLWQLLRRGLADRDGYGWSLTLAGQIIACQEGAA